MRPGPGKRPAATKPAASKPAATKPPPVRADDPDEALEPFRVSRETRARLEILVAELRRWQSAKNLVGPGTLDEIWHRHVADSLQLLDCAPPEATRWLDLGSGAGFPGLVLAIALAERSGAQVDLVEANSRKCAFLRHVARLTGAPARVHAARIEDVIGGFVGRTDIVTARALAPLDKLVGWCGELLKTGTIGLFPKGERVASELTALAQYPSLQVDDIPSRSDSRGTILRVARR